jgi:hypothetical protein
VILDAGFLISIDRGERAARNLLVALARRGQPLRTTHPVLAQVWRDGASQARLAAFLRSVEVLPLDDGKPLGRLLAVAGTADVVDAHLVLLAVRFGDAVLTGDPDDLGRVAAALGAAAPAIHAWP